MYEEMNDANRRSSRVIIDHPAVESVEVCLVRGDVKCTSKAAELTSKRPVFVSEKYDDVFIPIETWLFMTSSGFGSNEGRSEAKG
jgi:hypothetical protein